MTKQTEQVERKKVSILIGDDELINPQTRAIFNSDYSTELAERNPKYEFNWKIETEAEEVIREARTGRYDVVVTDLNYTNQGEEGYQIIDELQEIRDKSKLILCTSSDEPNIRAKVEGKVDFYSCPSHVNGDYFGRHKWGNLVNILDENIQTLKEKTIELKGDRE
jgi:ActR/RegA family two-component response regulator